MKKVKKKKTNKEKERRREKPLKLNMSFEEAMIKVLKIKPKSS